MDEDNRMTREEMQQITDESLVSVIKGGQSYRIGSRQLQRVDFAALKKFKDELDAAEAAENSNGFFDNCYVGIFDTR